MMRHFTVMRLVMAGLVVVAVTARNAQAQNYMPANDYNGAGVVVNMDVIGATAPSRLMRVPDAVLSAPVHSEPLSPVRVAKRKIAEPLPVSKPALATIAAGPDRVATKTPDRSWAEPVPQEKVAERRAVPPVPEKMVSAPIVASRPVENPPVVAVKSVSAVASQMQPAPQRQLLTAIADAPSAQPSAAPAKARTLPELLDPLSVKPTKLAKPEPVFLQTEQSVKAASIAPVATTSALAETIRDTRQNNTDFTIYRVLFDANSDALNPSETRVLDLLVKRLHADKTLTLQMAAFADGTPETAAQARRLSLMRALKLRGYLIDKDVAATRLDVRAMGTGSSEMNDKVTPGSKDADRVDLVLMR